jgi:XapX domain-containing protein
MTIVLGIPVGLGLVAFCWWLDIALWSPPKVVGAVTVLAVALGLIFADWAHTYRHAAASEQEGATPHAVGLAQAGPVNRRKLCDGQLIANSSFASRLPLPGQPPSRFAKRTPGPPTSWPRSPEAHLPRGNGSFAPGEMS